MKRTMRKMSGRGDGVVAEWDTETVSPEALTKIEAEFNARIAEGYFAADLGTNEIIHEFTANADIFLIPRMQGGSPGE